MNTDLPPAEVKVISNQPRKRGIWQALGGGALAFAIIFHAIILAIGAVWVFQITIEPEKKEVDFLPGNAKAGGSERGVQHQVQQKKIAQITPSTNVKRVFAEGALSSYSIPNPGDDFGQMSSLNSLGGGGLSGGLGGSGGGVGFGTSGGTGAGGAGLQPVMMFGLQLEETRKIGVVMDVSRSMTKYLPIVANELDKLSASGPLILYFGCGLTDQPKGSKFDDTVRPTNGRGFDRFWNIWQNNTSPTLTYDQVKALKYDRKSKMPLAAIHKQMSNRLDTYYVDFIGVYHAQVALLCEQLRDVDTIYWFADFDDRADADQMRLVRRKLKANKQKLVMHAVKKGRFFEQVRDGVVFPSGGTVIVKDVK